MCKCGKKFTEKIYFKVVANLKTRKLLNSTAIDLVTRPVTQSYMFTTKETGPKYLNEKPDTIVTEIIYAIPNNPLVLGSPNIRSYEIRINEKDSFLSYIGTEVLPGGIDPLPEVKFKSVVTGASGRFEGALEVTTIIRNTVKGDISTRTREITVTGHR